MAVDPKVTSATPSPITLNPNGTGVWSDLVMAPDPHRSASRAYRPEARYPDASRARGWWDDFNERRGGRLTDDNRVGPGGGLDLGLRRWSGSSLVNRDILHPVLDTTGCQGDHPNR